MGETDGFTAFDNLLQHGMGVLWRLVPIGNPKLNRFLIQNAGRGNQDMDDDEPMTDPDDWDCLFFGHDGTATHPSRPTGDEANGVWGHGDSDDNGQRECGILAQASGKGTAGPGAGKETQYIALMDNKQAVFTLTLLKEEGEDE